MRSALMGSLPQINGMSPPSVKRWVAAGGAGQFWQTSARSWSSCCVLFSGHRDRPGAVLVYDMQTSGLMVFDPDEKRLFYVAGDVW